MSTVVGFGQKQRMDMVRAHWRSVDFAVGESPVSLAKIVTGRGLLIAAAVAVVLISAGLPLALSLVGNHILASSPSLIASPPPIIAVPPPSKASAWPRDDVVQTTKYVKATYQEAIDMLAVQDIVVSQQTELRRLSNRVAALSAKLERIQRTATNTSKSPISLPWGLPKAAPPKSH
jgi:hypothetical protein